MGDPDGNQDRPHVVLDVPRKPHSGTGMDEAEVYLAKPGPSPREIFLADQYPVRIVWINGNHHGIVAFAARTLHPTVEMDNITRMGTPIHRAM